MRPFKRVKMLNADEYRVLKKAAAGHKISAGRARRAKIFLSSNQGYIAREIAEKLDCNERTALKWINRFDDEAARLVLGLPVDRACRPTSGGG